MYDLLYTFVVYAESGSSIQASAAIGITQPAILKRLRMLECRLGYELFDADQKGRFSARGADLFYAIEPEFRTLRRKLRVLDADII